LKLKRVLTAADAAWLVAGSMIGTGIFITPGIVADSLPGVAWPLAAWLVGGLVSLCGAAVYGELGARVPRPGGDYQFLNVAFGRRWGFLSGWSAITLSFSAAAAAQTRAAVEYLDAALPGLGLAALAAIWSPLLVGLLTWANTVGARAAGRATAALTAGPVVGLLVLFALVIIGGKLDLQLPDETLGAPAVTFGAFGVALIAVFFTYSGWNAAAYLAGELKRPERDLARGLIAGTGLVTALYVVMNVGLFLVLPREQFAGSVRPAADAARQLLGESGERVMAAIVAVAMLGSANVTLMAGARIYYAMAVDSLAPAALKRTNRAGVPSTALWVGGAWCAVLALFGTVRELVGWATLAILLLSSLTVAALFVLRRKGPSPGFRVPAYPWPAVIYLVVSLAAAVASYQYDRRHALLGLGIIGMGIPLYPLARRWFGRSEPGG
jgi:APA family basic amino acid/polyamine antiporter